MSAPMPTSQRPEKIVANGVGVAARTALLDRLQQLTDGLAIVVGRAARRRRSLDAVQIDAGRW